METEERDNLTRETHQALLGIPGTEDKGLVGDFKDIKTVVMKNSKDINTIWTLQVERNKPSKKALSGYGAGVLAIGAALWKAFIG